MHKMENKPVILTGIRSNGELTLGNYLGAILPLVNMQKEHAGEYQINMFVPDLHSFTTPVDHSTLYENTLANLKLFLAGGLDISNPDTFIYRQSFIPAHAELTWILDCFIYFGELNRMTQFKDKSEGKESVSAGLFNYPALMAADILLYGAKYIPVGEDQRQHIELTRDVAIRMNNQFGEIFTIPEPWDKQLKFSRLHRGVRIRSLKHPENKMSKSVSDPSGTILLNDDPSEAAKKIMSATTDSLGEVHFDYKQQPGVSNLLQIIALLSNKPIETVIDEWTGNTSYGELKKTAAELVKNRLEQLQANVKSVKRKDITDRLEKDEAAMNKIAGYKLHKVQSAVGLRQR